MVRRRQRRRSPIIRPMPSSPRTVGIAAAVVTVAIWTGFIVIGRASAAHTLLPFDIALLRILGAGAVLLPWGWLLARRAAPGQRSLLGFSPLPLRPTLLTGLFGGLVYAILCYAGFFYAPAAHASVLMPGSLPLWTALLAALVLRDRITPARALGLACIVVGDLVVGGASLLQAFNGGSVWKGDVIFMSAAFCWSVYSVLARKFGLEAVRATIAITAFAFLHLRAAVRAAHGQRRAADASGQRTMGRDRVSGAVPGRGLGGDFGHHLRADGARLRAGQIDHDHGAGARPVGAGRGVAAGRAAGLEPAGGSGPRHRRHFVWRARDAAENY